MKLTSKVWISVRFGVVALLGWIALGDSTPPMALATAPTAAPPPSYRERAFRDDTVYFLVLDRFAKDPDFPTSADLPGEDPSQLRFYHGGTLRGAMDKLDYLQRLGVTAIWITPVFENQPITGYRDGKPFSTAYHGYGIINFEKIDPHFGTDADFLAFVAAAHQRDIKVFLDIVVNHTANIIQYRECPEVGNRDWDPALPPDQHCPYRSKSDYPYNRRASDHAAINPGFAGDDADHQTKANFAHLTDMRYAYTPYIPPGLEHVKVPDWLNNIRYYHNRGDLTFQGESALDGDFAGLDDVFTENPRVVDGFVDIYRYWVRHAGIDGYRIDTARHVNVEFWQKFLPDIERTARQSGTPEFFMFGEDADFSGDPSRLAMFMKQTDFPAVLDFPFFLSVAKILSGRSSAADFASVFHADSDFPAKNGGPASLPNFVSNHDNGRLAYLIRKANPTMPSEELEKRVLAGHALMMFSRGVPILYYGDEQGFVGRGDDNWARQDMFPTAVAEFQTEEILGPTHAADADHFDVMHPMYRAIAEMAAYRHRYPSLRHGTMAMISLSNQGGLVGWTRSDPKTGETFVIAVNLSPVPQQGRVTMPVGASDWQSIRGDCGMPAEAGSSQRLAVAPWDYQICWYQRKPSKQSIAKSK